MSSPLGDVRQSPGLLWRGGAVAEVQALLEFGDAVGFLDCERQLL